MKQSTFEHELNKAKTFGKIDSLDHDYWAGYQRGLRRRYHGENFGTEQEHQIWLSASGDESRALRSQGYRDGYYGLCDWDEPAKALPILRTWHGWSTTELAERLGRSQRTVEGWEQGRTIPEAALKSLQKLWLAD